MIENIPFIRKSMLICFMLAFFSLNCKDNKNTKETDSVSHSSDLETTDKPFFKISLAQWSLHKAILNDKTLDPIDFAEKAKSMGFPAVEYVSGLYNPQIESMGMQPLLDTLKAKSEEHQVENLLIMVDGEGELSSPSEEERNKAVEGHKKWVDAAAYLGCHSIRVNLFGTRDPDIWVDASTDGLVKLSQYAATKNVNVLVENHGYLSSNADLLKLVMMNVEMTNCGTLPDFGNFCLEREGGEQWGTKCIKEYDRYIGVKKLMPWAKAVSAKSNDFDEHGNETRTDYVKMLQIVKDASYRGYIGIEYEGDDLSEEEGIIATRDLLLKVSKELN